MVWLPGGEKKFEDMFIRFDSIHECDGQTDSRTDIARRHRPRLCGLCRRAAIQELSYRKQIARQLRTQ